MTSEAAEQQTLIDLDSRSSVASKRFPLSDGWLARFRFAWMFFAQGGPNGTASSEKNLRSHSRLRAN
jgi:hypothetical protein